MNNRSVYFDVLKAVAIIAVVFYHLGICGFGYLGVDVFLVIAGYFTLKSIEKQQLVNGGGYVKFVLNRVYRLLPLLLIAGATCLILGWYFMLPDDYENVAQSIVASNFFANNILQSITVRDYWATTNEYRPLMHTWYVGLLMQFYIFVPLILFIIARFTKENRRTISLAILIGIGVLSLLMYIFSDSDVNRFYYLPYRLYEFCIGGILALVGVKSYNKSNITSNILFVLLYLILLLILFSEITIVSSVFKLLATVTITAILLYLMPRITIAQNNLFSNRCIAIIGMSSFSIFVWHQVVFAWVRYSFTNNLIQFHVLLIITALIVILSYLSYRYVEKLSQTRKMWIIVLVAMFVTTAYSLYLYKNAGVIRDVSELDIKQGEARRGQWAEYCDRGYQFDRDFESDTKPHWLVIGNSYGRDWVNIIQESEIADRVEVSYTSDYIARKDRFKYADVVFLSTLGVDETMIENIKKCCKSNTRFYIVGEKNFGESNGQIYRKRNSKDYHQMHISMEDGFAEKNARLKRIYSDNYIDLIELVSQADGRVKVFSNDNRYLSQDCHHLTEAGAQYYAGIINWDIFFSN